MWQGTGPFEALTHATFNVVSVVTTTGYASEDYTAWGAMAVVAFFYLTFVGGCSGSTSGGMKIFRFQVAAILLRNQLRYLIHASGVFPNRYNGQPLTDEITRGVVAFSFFFFLTIAALALALSMMGLDIVTALSGLPLRWPTSARDSATPSARPATSPPCPMPPNGCCALACYWVGWRS